MFRTGRNRAACQPLLFPTAKIRHQPLSNLKCRWSCQPIFDISAIILRPSVRTNLLYAKATVIFFSPHVPICFWGFKLFPVQTVLQSTAFTAFHAFTSGIVIGSWGFGRAILQSIRMFLSAPLCNIAMSVF